MIARKHAPLLSGLLLSGVMSLLVSGVATLRAAGLSATFLATWMQAWVTAWGLAFPAVLLAAPWTRRLVDRITRTD
ncbi:DUF2798 domain-containing protein [Aquabacterium sp. CECT 9606]|uniref:DUF2798 domain-containing protein n=1 Tax=Aquabacterium sp. CECT 9606 TaxID=2845822 RepID=UPI001E5F06EC|nr:DUF2798 domain-containing protein [Aquabacterium sp. CECT 9606]CAH0347887.1 hypothetical protein AQB9606_00106 [Aquabacterium sp. CECT 9606]